MTCREFENLLLEEAGAPEAASHAAACAPCSAMLARRRSLAAAMKALAAESADALPAAAVETNLLRALRSASQPSVRTRIMPAWRWGAVAAAAAIAAVFLWLGNAGTVVAPPPMPMPPIASAHLPEPVASTPEPALRTRRSAGHAAPVRKVMARPAVQPAAGESEFIPIPFTARVGAGESLDIVRVRMPRSAMVRFGMPVNAERASEPVSADLVVSQDGVLRAIRFVR